MTIPSEALKVCGKCDEEKKNLKIFIKELQENLIQSVKVVLKQGIDPKGSVQIGRIF